MGRKGKAQKHTAAEIAGKHAAAKAKNGGVGGGKSAQASRAAAGAKVAIVCPTCFVQQPNAKSMKLHCENRHPKIPYDEEKWNEEFKAKRGAHAEAAKPKQKAKAPKKKASTLDRMNAAGDGGFSLF